MRRFFLLIITRLVITGAVSDNERMEAKSGENLTMRVEKPGLGNVRLVTLQKDCENGTEDEMYCSPEEERSGCTAKKSERFSFMMDSDSFSLILADVKASDEGCYIVSCVDFANILTHKEFIVKVHEQLPSTINPEPPSIYPFTTPAISTKGEETHPTTTVSTERNHKVTWGLAGVIAVAIVVIFGIICCKKKKQGSADDDLENPLKQLHSNTNTNGVGEPATDEVLETVDETNCSVDNEEGPENGSTGQRNL